MPDPYRLTGLQGLAGLRGLGGGGGLRKYRDPGVNLKPYLPGEEEVQTEIGEQKQEEERGWFWDLLAFSEKLFLGQAIKGAIRGGAEEGAEGVLSGFASGLGTITDTLGITNNAGRETSFADIRKAFGDSSDQEGVANFGINLVGDIILSPLELLANPFGAVGKLGTTAGKVAPSFAKAFETGQRAMIAFRLPFTDVFLGAIGKVKPTTPLGLKSVYTNLGRGIDVFQGAMRTNPVTRPIARVFFGSPNVADPTAADAIRGAGNSREDTKNAIEHLFWTIYNSKVGPAARDWYEKNPQYHSVLLTLQELGFSKFDDLGAISKQIRNADYYVRLNKRARLLATDLEFSKLYKQAENGNMDAIQKLYGEYKDIPLPEGWLQNAGLTPRSGAELSTFDAPTVGGTLTLPPGTSGLPPTTPLTPGEFGRTTTRVDKAHEILTPLRERLVTKATDLFRQIETGKLDRNHVEGFLQAHKTAMEEIGKREVAAGILNSSFEQFLGPYAHRVMTPEIKKAINDHFEVTVKKNLGADGLNLTRSFMQHRTITDLLTVEANALFNEFGTKFTNYIPVKDIRKFGAAEAAAGHVFGNDFWRKLQKMGPEGKEVAEFFRINPLLNDYTRYIRAGEVLGDRNFWGSVFKGPMVRETFDASDTKKYQEWAADKDVAMVFETEDHRIRIPQRGEILSDEVHREIRTRADIHSNKAKDDLMVRSQEVTHDFRKEYKDLTDAYNLKVDAKEEVLNQIEKNGYTGFQMARATRSLKHIEEESAGMRSLEHLYDYRYTKGHPPHTGHGVFRGNVNDIVHDPELNARLDLMRADVSGSVEAARQAQRHRVVLKKKLDELYSTKQRFEDTGEVIKPGRFEGEVGVSKEYITPTQFDNAARVSQEIKLTEEHIDQLSWSDDYGNLLNVKSPQKLEKAINSALRTRIRRGIGNLNAGRGSAMDEIRAVKDAIAEQTHNVGLLFDDAIQHAGSMRSAARATFKTKQKGLKKVYGDRLAAIQDMIDNGVPPHILNEELRRMNAYRTNGILAVDEAKETMVRRLSKDPTTGRTVEVHEPLFDRVVRNNPEMKIHVIDREHLRSAIEFREEYLRPDPLKNHPWFKALDWVRTTWATSVTINPLLLGTRFRDVMQNAQALSFGGAKYPFSGTSTALSITNAIRKSIKYGGTPEDFLGARTVRLGEVDYKLSEIYQAAQARAIAGSGIFKHEVIGSLTDAARLQRPGAKAIDYVKDLHSLVLPFKKAENSAWLRAGYRLANWADDTSRLSGYVDALKRGMDLDTAADHVKKWMYDPGRNLTYTEKTYFKRFIPFYSFQKYAMKQSLDVLMSRPGLVTAFDKFRTAAYASPPGGGAPLSEQETATILPRFISDGLGIPMKNTKQGPVFSVFGSFFPLGELAQLLGSVEQTVKGTDTFATARYVGAKLHPLIKEGMEQVFNKDFYFNNDIASIPGDTVEYAGMNVYKRLRHVVKAFRVVNDFERLGFLNKNEADSIIRTSAAQQVPKNHALSWFESFISSSFSPVAIPKAYPIDSLEEFRKLQMRDSIELQKTTSQLKKRVEDGLAPDDAAAKALRGLITERVAKMQRREAMARNAELDKALVKKIRFNKQLREKAGLK